MAFVLDHGANIDMIEPEFDQDGNPRQVNCYTGIALCCPVENENARHEQVIFLLRTGPGRRIKGVMELTQFDVAKICICTKRWTSSAMNEPTFLHVIQYIASTHRIVLVFRPVCR
jgi:hypothetical protein